MSKPNAKPATPAASAAAPAPSAKPAQPVDTALAAEGDSQDVTAADIAAALGLKPSSTPAGDDLTDEERAAAEAELDADDTAEDFPDSSDAGDDAADSAEATPAAAEPAAPSAELTAAQAKLAEAEAKAAAAESALAATREKLATFEAESTTRTDAGVLDTITDLDGLAAQRSRFVNLYAWAVKHPDGGALPDGKGGEIELTRDEVANVQAEAFTIVQDGIPKREAFLRAAAAREAEALNAYPWIKETTRGIGAEAAKLLNDAPALRRLPEAKLIAADSVIGARLRAAGVTVDEATLTKMIAAAKPTAAGKPAALSTPPRVPPASPARPGVLPPRSRGNESAVRAAAQNMQRSRGSEESIAASIAAKLAR